MDSGLFSVKAIVVDYNHFSSLGKRVNGFSANNKSEHKQFIQNNQKLLLQLGLHVKTMEYKPWVYLLEHGNCIYTGWSSDALDKNQSAVLLQLVERYSGQFSPTLLQDLRRKMAEE